MLTEKNQFGGETTHTEAFVDGFLERTTSLPVEGERKETFYHDGRLAKATGNASQPVRYEYGAESDEGSIATYVKETKLDAAGTATAEWTKTYSDGAGRPYKTVYFAAGGEANAVRRSYYNSKGQLWKEKDPDGVFTLIHFNGEGEEDYRIQPVGAAAGIYGSGASYETLTYETFNPGLHLATQDRVSKVERSLVFSHDVNVWKTETYVWKTPNANAATLVRSSEQSLTSLDRWETIWNDGVPVTTRTHQDITRASAQRVETATAPDQTKTVSTFVQGQLESVAKLDSANPGVQLTKTSYKYDVVGRLENLIDARTGTTTYAYPSPLRQDVTTPAPGSGYAPQTTITTYDLRGLVSTITHPDNGLVTQTYWPTMRLKRVSGARTYPVEYDYDAQGRMRHMYTWQVDGNAATKATTTWNYDPYRGWLESKRDHAGLGADYTYTLGGRLKTRQWARSQNGSRVLTTYNYGFDDGVANNEHGDLASVTYSDSTPGVTYTYDRLGRQASVARNGITTALNYNDAGQLLGEAYASGTLAGLAVALTRDNALRRDQLSVTLNGSTLLPTVTHLYNTGGRLDSVSDGSYSAAYEYAPNSAHLYRTTFKQGTTARMATTRDWDNINRLRSISSTAGGFVVSSHAYHYNNANQRDRADLRDGSY